MIAWRVLIADDEPAARRGVRQLLAGHDDFTVVGECRHGPETLTALARVRPDLVFLDIRMPGLDGFEVLERGRPAASPLVVFLTAFDDFAVRAFEVEAFDYLVKPVPAARFDETLTRARRRLAERAAGRDVPLIEVATSRGSGWIPASAIDWIESDGNYARVWSAGKAHLVRRTLTSLATELGAAGFLRTHRGAVVRLACVRRVANGEDGRVVALLESGARVPVSRRRVAALRRALRGRRPPTV